MHLLACISFTQTLIQWTSTKATQGPVSPVHCPQPPVPAVPTCAEPVALGNKGTEEVIRTPEPNPKTFLISTPTPRAERY